MTSLEDIDSIAEIFCSHKGTFSSGPVIMDVYV